MIIIGVGAVPDTSCLTLTTCKYEHLYFEFLLAPSLTQPFLSI